MKRLLLLLCSFSALALAQVEIPYFQNMKNGAIRLPERLVEDLPPATQNEGKVFIVTNASTAGSCTVGLGTAQSICRSNGTSWVSIGGAAGGGSGTVTHTAGALGANLILAGNGGADIQAPSSAATLDSSGNIVATSVTTGAGGAAGFYQFGQGTAPNGAGTVLGGATGAVQIYADTAVTAYAWKLPTADAAGALSSDGSGALSLKSFSGTGDIALVGSPTFTGTVNAAGLALSGALTTSITGGGTQCVHVSNTGVLSGTGSDCGAGGGSGTVTNTGTLGASAIVVGNGGVDVKTPSATSTLDASGNMILAGGLTLGAGGSVGGYSEYGQGTAPTIGASAVQIAAPATVSTGYQIILPGAAGNGFFKGANSSNVETMTFSAIAAADLPATPLTAGSGTVSLTGPREYYVCTTTCTVTPPAPVAGYEFCVMNDDNVSTVITMGALGSSAMYEDPARTAYGTAGTGTLVSGGAAGDKVCIVGLDSTHYLTVSSAGSWTAN